MGWEELKTESATQLDLLHPHLPQAQRSIASRPGRPRVREESAIECLRCDGLAEEEEGDKKRRRQIKESERVMELGKGHGRADSHITSKSRIKASFKPFRF